MTVSNMLKRFVKLVIEAEVAVRKEAEYEDEEEVNEFSGVGSIAGYSLPLGADPDQYGRQKNKTRKKK